MAMLKQQMVHSQLAAASSALQMIRMTKTGLVLASFLLASQANALSITGVTADPGATLVSAWLGSDSGITVTAGTVAYVGNTSVQQSGIYTGFDLISSDPTKPDISLADGILLTTGTALIPMTNTASGFGTVTNTAGNSWINAMVGGQISSDSNVLSFDFTVADGVTSVATSFVYGSEEFPEYAGTAFADGFAFIVDGVNYARFADGSWVSLATLSSNTNLNNNTGGAYGIEYDGITNALQVTGLLDLGRTTHTLEVVIADTGDRIYDSGVFVAGLRVGQAGSGGVNNIPPVSGGGDNVSPVPEPETYAMLLAGLALLGVAGRRRKKG